MLGVLGVLNVQNVLYVLNVLNVLNMPKDASLACRALFSFFFLFPVHFDANSWPLGHEVDLYVPPNSQSCFKLTLLILRLVVFARSAHDWRKYALL